MAPAAAGCASGRGACHPPVRPYVQPMSASHEENHQEDGMVHDLRVSGGCSTCGGDMAMRVGPSGAWAYCARCHRLSRPVLFASPGGPRLGELPAAA